METSTIRLSTHFRDERPTSSHHCNGFPWFFFAERLVTGLVTGDSKYSKRGWLKPPVDRKRYNDERTVRNDRGRCGRVNYNDFTLVSLHDISVLIRMDPDSKGTLNVYTKDCLIGALSSQQILLFGGGINVYKEK
ncbi:hypothetical protein HZH68_007955 [Vespula germanica]|uniref:Uncharacterized protein n=1 Tax=Vespula germanica TaxID=30212 RepID=A0A834N9K6_VESGE|nr:hypothetical protein HZH68_007955 [Vespula germanica]